MAAGGAFLAAGTVGALTDYPPAPVWLALGGGFGAWGALLYLVPSGAEKIARQHRVFEIRAPSATQARALEQAWAEHAHQARVARWVAGGVSLAASGAMVGFGTGVALGAFDVQPDNERVLVSALLISGGAALGVVSLYSMISLTPAERTLRAYQAGVEGSAVDVSEHPPRLRLGSAPGGMGLSLRGTF